MREISIDESTFKRLQRHARPLDDTPDTVINRALDALEKGKRGLTTDRSEPGDEKKRDLRGLGFQRHTRFPAGSEEAESPIRGEIHIDPRNPPDLRHAKVLDAYIDGADIPNPRWKLLVERVIIIAMKRLGDFDEVQRICPANMVRGQKSRDGYTHLPEVDVSVQGQDAKRSFQSVVETAAGLNISLEIGIVWLNKEGAAHPGERGRMTMNATSNNSRF
ncbi:MAG: hypothetical protein MPK62_12450 [Alphaproteobacteria bacterium]|nr:hypothetical protein [Alphaproteobacteria bacterium]MDA8031906.1 hypothetical protein [Alphaproteobacteria bacterium]